MKKITFYVLGALLLTTINLEAHAGNYICAAHEDYEVTEKVNLSLIMLNLSIKSSNSEKVIEECGEPGLNFIEVDQGDVNNQYLFCFEISKSGNYLISDEIVGGIGNPAEYEGKHGDTIIARYRSVPSDVFVDYLNQECSGQEQLKIIRAAQATPQLLKDHFPGPMEDAFFEIFYY